MNRFRHVGNIKAGLFLIGIILVVALLFYSQKIVDELREDNRQIVKLYAEIIAKVAGDPNDTNLDFIFEEIIKKVQFPIIYSDPDQLPLFHRNLPDSAHSTEELIVFRETMDRTNEPIPIFYIDPATKIELPIGYIHYGDSQLIRKLQLLPFLELSMVALFILLGFIGFSVIRNSEKRNIWVGMARETAHQLSTPVSALLGWVDWLKEHPEKAPELITDMSVDLDRLQMVTNRFSKMGTETEYSKESLFIVAESVAEYLRRRLPSMGKNIAIVNNIPENLTALVNGTLLSWAIENVVKNAIDAICTDTGEIILSAEKQDSETVLLIKDNGKGIPRRDWKNVFRPGFSTKDRGWGLGLSLTNRIITELHRGKIKIIKSEVNGGTTFSITLPVID